MSMPNESAPPIRELPDEIEAAITDYAGAAFKRGRGDNAADVAGAEDRLCAAIHAALDDQTRDYQASIDRLIAELDPFREQEQALRERCERLRALCAYLEHELDPYYWVRMRERLQPGDLADDLRPRGGDEG